MKKTLSVVMVAFFALTVPALAGIDVELGDLSFSRPPQKRQVPQVLTHDEAMLVLGHLNYPYSLMAKLMYGTGLRSIRYRNGSGVITCTGARCRSILSAR